MGGKSSKQEAAERQQINLAAIPNDPIPYQGPALQYSFLNVSVQMKAHMSFGFSRGETVVTSNVDEYYPHIAQNYSQGFKIVQFVKIPLTQTQGGMFSMSAMVPYQAVYCRKASDTGQSNSWQLKIEKSLIHMRTIGSGLMFSLSGSGVQSSSDMSHICDIIQRNAALGGRFVCMEQSGAAEAQGMGMAWSGIGPGMGTDLFFNMPLHPNPIIYTYMAISVPIPLKFSYGTVDIVCDWQGNLAQYFNQGWRLADIYLDDFQQLHSARKHNFRISSINSVWFFEKELSKLNDPTPVYQVTYLEYQIKGKVGFGSMSSDFDITQLCQEMGNRGWKLTCVLPTPKVVSCGLTSFINTVLLFFQRRMIGPVAPVANVPVAGASGPIPTALPPSYDAVSKSD